MRLLIHSDASFLVEWDAKINYGGYFYLGWNQNDDYPQKINGAVDVSTSLLPLVVISVAEAELGGRFYNAKKGEGVTPHPGRNGLEARPNNNICGQ